MNFENKDIEHKKGTVWISERLLIQVTDISKKTFRTVYRYRYKKSVKATYHRHNLMPITGKSWRYGTIHNKPYYDINYISKKYRSLFGDKEKLVANYHAAMKKNFKDSFYVKFSTHLEVRYKHFLQFYGQPHTKDQQYGLAKACAILEFVSEYKIDNPEEKPNVVYRNTCEIIKSYKMSYIPKQYREFSRKIAKYENGEEIYEIIYLPRAGNSNAILKIEEEVKSWALQMRAMGQNYSNAHIIRKVQDMCRLTNKNTPSARWFGQNIFELHKTKFLTAVSRFGSNTRGSKMYEGYIPMKNAIFAGDAWQVDATRVNIIAHKDENGDKKHLFIIAVRDVHSGDVLGYHFDYKEDRWSVINAFKMAVQEAGYLPYEIVFDRFPGHNTEEAKRMFAQLEQMGVKVTFTHKATGKAGLERWFGTLQSVFMMDSEYYYGEGVQSKRLNAHRSPEHLKLVKSKAHKAGFDLDDATHEAQLIVEAYRSTVFSYYSRKFRDINKSPKMLHSESEKPHVKWLEEYQISMLFGLKKKLQIRNNGLIKTEIYKATYYFQIEDYEILSKYKEVIISYDVNDLSSVYLFTAKNHFLVHLGTAVAFEEIQPYGPQAEFNRIAKEKQRQKAIDDKRNAELATLTGTAADEVELLMGRFTDKGTKENTESIRLLNEANSNETKAIKKAVGSEFEDSDNSSDIDLVSLTINQY